MIGSLIGWCFDLLGRIWDGFWNVSGKLLKLAVLSALLGAVFAAAAKFNAATSSEAWYLFKIGAMIGVVVLGIRLLITEVAVPQVHAYENRERQRKRREMELQIARERARDRQESISRRLKTLN